MGIRQWFQYDYEDIENVPGYASRYRSLSADLDGAQVSYVTSDTYAFEVFKKAKKEFNSRTLPQDIPSQMARAYYVPEESE